MRRRWLLSLLCGLLLATTALAQVPGSPSRTWGPVSLQAPLNVSHPQTRGLVSMWQVLPGLDGGRLWYDLRGSWNLAIGVTPTEGATGTGGTTRPGGLGEMRFDGTNDNAVAAGSEATYAFADTTFTVTFWFRTASLASQQFLVAEQYQVLFPGGWVVRLETSGVVRAKSLDATDSTVASRDSTSTLAVNTWYHVAAIFTTNTSTQAGNAVTVYINGLLDQGSQSDGANPYAVCGCPLILGTQGNGGSPFTGAMDDVRIYTYGLSAEEVFQVYDLSRRGNPGLLQRFGTGTGTPAVASLPTRKRARIQ